MKHGGGEFNKSANLLYSALNEEERLKLEASAVAKAQQKMTVKEIKKAGVKIFTKIQKQ